MTPVALAAAAPSTPAGVPTLALRLGYAGLVPFIGGAALTWLVRADAQPYVTIALAGWAAVVLSFIAGIPWALTMLRPELGPLGWWASALLAGLGWVGFVMQAYAGLVVLGALLFASYLFDRRYYPRAGLAHWLTLRFRLSMIASLCCFLGAAGT